MKLLVCFASTFALACVFHDTGSPFYTDTVIAKSGDSLDGFPAQSFKRTVSLNDNGHVAFIADGAGGSKAVFVAVPGVNGYVLRKLAETTSGNYGSVCVNNRNEVAASVSAVSRGITSAKVRRYTPDAASGAYLGTAIAKATTARQTVTIDPCQPWVNCSFTTLTDVASRTAGDADA